MGFRSLAYCDVGHLEENSAKDKRAEVSNAVTFLFFGLGYPKHQAGFYVSE